MDALLLAGLLIAGGLGGDRAFPGALSRRTFTAGSLGACFSPAATLHHEAVTLLAEDPVLSAANQNLHHSVLGAIARGAATAGKLANRLRRTVSNLDPVLKRLVAAGFVVRREEVVREWVRRHAAEQSVGGLPAHVGPSSISVDRVEREIDVVVAEGAAPDTAPGDRTVRAIGEAKAGEVMALQALRRLEATRSALGRRGEEAKLLLISPAFAPDLLQEAEGRPDVELVDLERPCRGD